MKFKKIIIILIVIIGLGFILSSFLNKNSDLKVVNQPVPTTAPVAETPNIPLPAPEPGVDASQSSWTFERYQTLMTESGRNPGINTNIFAEIQKRKVQAVEIVKNYLTAQLGSADPEVVRAFGEVPREYFSYQYQNNRSFADVSYENKASKVKPW